MNIQPLFDNVLLRVLEDNNEHGIVIPDSAVKDKPQRAEVVAIGTGHEYDDDEPLIFVEGGKSRKFKVKVGHKVIFRKYAPDEIEVDGEKLLIISEEEIFAVETE